MSIYAPPSWQCDPAEVKWVGVVWAGHLYVVTHRDPRRGAAPRIVSRFGLVSGDAAEIAGEAFTHACGAVWVADSNVGLWYASDDPYYLWHEISSGGQIAGLVAQKRGRDRDGIGLPLCIYKPMVNDAWGMGRALVDMPGGESNIVTFVAGLALASFALGQQLRFSASYSGNAMLRTELAAYERRTGREIPPLSAEWRERLAQMLPSPVMWRRRMTARGVGTHGMIPVHLYDRNMSYVSSAREVPTGDPQETRRYRKHLPGVYEAPDQGILWEPQLRATPYEALWRGYYWPRSQLIDLRWWSERIWDARKQCHATAGPIGRIAEAIVKRVGVATIGRLIQHTGRAMMPIERAKLTGAPVLSYESDARGNLTGNVEVEAQIGRDDLVWPHVWATIISNANERVEATIERHARYDTLLAYVDQFYCIDRHPVLDGDPMKPGGWKYGGCFEVPLADLDALNAPEIDAAALVKRFARYRRAQGTTARMPTYGPRPTHI